MLKPHDHAVSQDWNYECLSYLIYKLIMLRGRILLFKEVRGHWRLKAKVLYLKNILRGKEPLSPWLSGLVSQKGYLWSPQQGWRS